MSVSLFEFERIVAVDTPNVSYPLLTHTVRQAAIQFCKETNILKRTFEVTVDTDDVDSTDLQEGYDVDLVDFISTEAPVTLIQLSIDSVVWAIEHRDIRGTITYYDSILDTSTKYFTFPSSNTLRLFNMGDHDGDVLFITLAVKPQQTSTVVDSRLYDDWLEPIIAGAKYRLMSMPNQPWSDLTGAKHNFTLFTTGMAEAKATVAKGFTKQSTTVIPNGYDFWGI